MATAVGIDLGATNSVITAWQAGETGSDPQRRGRTNHPVTRSEFDDLTADLVERCIGPVQQATSDAKLSANDIDEVLLVGGSTRIPAVQALVRRLTGGTDRRGLRERHGTQVIEKSSVPDPAIAQRLTVRAVHGQVWARQSGAASVAVLRRWLDKSLAKHTVGRHAHDIDAPGSRRGSYQTRLPAYPQGLRRVPAAR
jgi:molecular chaperone DnaK (HSP70)